MDKEETPHITRRTTRSLASNTNSKEALQTTRSVSPSLPTLKDLLWPGETPTSFDDLLSSLPGRAVQILDLLRLIGPVDSPMHPLFLYGGPSTGKTSVILRIFQHLNRPFVYASCLSCYNTRVLFESVLNQLFLHKKTAENGYSSAKYCERPSDFVSYLRDGLTSAVNNFDRNSNQLSGQSTGKMIYLIFDNLELVRDWDKSSTVLPFLFDLYDILKLPEVGIIFISNASPDTYYSNTGYAEPIPVHFPDYVEDDLRKIFMRNHADPKLYGCFLDVVLKPFYRVTRRVDELATVFPSLFKTCLEFLSDVRDVSNEEMKRRLFSHLQPHIASSLNEIFRVQSHSLEIKANKEGTKQKSRASRHGGCEAFDEMDFHMSISAQYLLISAFLASRNPATLDASLFDSTGGSANRKRKRKNSQKSVEKEHAEQELHMKGPGSFPLERLLAIFQCITSLMDASHDEEEPGIDGVTAEGGDSSGLMSDVLLQLSSLCSANFITKGGSCPLDGSTRYRCIVSEETALKVARGLKFPLSKYLYRR